MLRGLSQEERMVLRQSPDELAGPTASRLLTVCGLDGSEVQLPLEDTMTVDDLRKSVARRIGLRLGGMLVLLAGGKTLDDSKPLVEQVQGDVITYVVQQVALGMFVNKYKYRYKYRHRYKTQKSIYICIYIYIETCLFLSCYVWLQEDPIDFRFFFRRLIEANLGWRREGSCCVSPRLSRPAPERGGRRRQGRHLFVGIWAAEVPLSWLGNILHC